MDNVWARFFPILENDLLKVDKILGSTFLVGKKRLWRIQSFVVDGLFTIPVYSRRRGRFVNSTFPNKKNLAQKSEFIYDKQNLKANVCRNSTFQVNRTKNATWRRRLTSRNRAAILIFQNFMRITTQQTFSAINLASPQKTTKLLFPSQVRKQFKL